MRARLFAQSAMVAFLFNAVPAYAQDAADGANASAVADTEIIVTAQKREERLRDVPLAVSAVSGGLLIQAAQRCTGGLQPQSRRTNCISSHSRHPH
ncbi:MAG: hypothetical protein HC788_01245 [Sphingopyxis sp.]|nr:hypothetical protein [Sphingopyxis sp.]